MGRIVWSLAVLLVACAEPTRAYLPRADFVSELGFFITVSESGAAIRQEGPISFAQDSPILVNAPENESESLLFVGWTRAQLGAASPSFDPNQIEQLKLHFEGQSCSHGLYAVDGSTLRLPLPEPTEWLQLAGANAWRPMAASSEAVSRLGPMSLEIVPDSTRCFGEDTMRFEPYGGIDPILREGDLVAGRAITRGALSFHDVFRLDDDRVLVTSDHSVLLLERGVPFTDQPGHAVELVEPQSGFGLRDVVVDQDPNRGEGGLRVFVAAFRVAPVTTFEDPGLLSELRLGPGGLEFVGTIIASASPIETLVLNPSDGRLVAGTRPAAIYTMLPGQPLERVQLPTNDDKRVDLVLTGLPDRPYAAIGTAPGTLLFGDPTAKDWVAEQGLPDGAAFRGFAVRHRSDGPELWIGDSNGDTFVKAPGGRWEKVTPELGPEYQGCFTQDPECRWYRPARPNRAIVPLDDYEPSRLLFVFEGCSGIVNVRADARCSTITPLADRPIRLLSAGASLPGVRRSAAWVDVPTNDGSIFELPARPN